MANASEPKKPTTKRRLKPAAQTVRQQAEQAQTKADQPPKTRRLQAAAETGRKPLGKVGRGLNKVFNRQPFRFIGRILLPRFVRGAFREVSMVTWPNRRETIRLTFAVIVFAIAFGAVVTAVDYGLDKVFKALIIDN